MIQTKIISKKISDMDLCPNLDHCRGDGNYVDQTLLLVQKRGQGIPHDAIQSGHRETGEDKITISQPLHCYFICENFRLSNFQTFLETTILLQYFDF